MKKLLLLCLLALSAAAWPSNPFLQRLSQQLDRWQSARPEDKVYLQTDRPLYRPGETIWFGVQVRDGATLQASAQSQIVRVELIDPKGQVQKKFQLIAQQGVAQGEYDLSEQAPGGLYKLRAYTQWQQNDPNPAIFEQELTVQRVVLPRLKMQLDFQRKAYGPGAMVAADLSLQPDNQQPLAHQPLRYVVSRDGRPLLDSTAQTNAEGQATLRFALPPNLTSPDVLLNVLIEYQGQTESISRAVPVVLNRIGLEFFPEGGDLVQGLPGRVAFRARNEHGKPADLAGVLLDPQGRELTRFASYHDGMGALAFTPQPGQRYQVRLTEPQGVDSLYQLPATLPQGYGLQVRTVTREQATLVLRSTQRATVSLIGTVRGQAYFTAEVPIERDSQVVEVPLADFPIGVARFTLFDAQQVERCERLAFVNRHRQLQIEIETDQRQYLPREKVALTLRTRDAQGRPVPADLSLSVVDDQLLSFADDKSSNLLSWLLVESEIVGEVAEPTFYFDPEEEKAAQALDYLLMAAGWRRFTWAQMQQGPYQPLAHRPERTVLHGKVWGYNGQPLPEARIRVGDSPVELRSNARGEFHLHHVDLSQPTPIWVRSPDSAWEEVFWPQRYGDTLQCHLGHIEGRVVDERGEPMMGATIRAVNAQRKICYGAYTDLEGKFQFRIGPKLGKDGYFLISHVGYQTDTIPLTQWRQGQTIALKPRPGSHLNEVVIVQAAKPRRRNRVVSSALTAEPNRSFEVKKKSRVNVEAPKVGEVFVDGEIDSEKDQPRPKPAPSEEVDRLRAVEAAQAQMSAEKMAEIEALRSQLEKMEVQANRQKAALEPAPDINDFIFADEEPRPLNLSEIVKRIGYPQMAREAGIDGTVVLRVLVGKDGTYRRHKVIDQAHPMLTEAVTEHIDQVKFTPAIQGGKPIPFWVNIPFHIKPLSDEDDLPPPTDWMPAIPTHLRQTRIRSTGQPGPINLGEAWSLFQYPKIAQEANIQGEVRFRVQVNAQGKYVQHELMAQAHPILTKAVEPHLSALRYQPAEADSLRWVEVPFRFELTDPSEFDLPNFTPPKARKPQRMPYHRVRQFPVPTYDAPAPANQPRDDFRRTLYWNGHVQTDAQGEATLRFPTSDALTSFRLTVEGLSRRGLPGRAETVIFTQKPLALQARLPVQLIAQDTLRLPLTVLNHSPQAMTAELSYRIPDALAALEELPTRLDLAAGESRTLYLPLRVVAARGDGRLEVRLAAGGFSDAVAQTLRIVPRGYPLEQAFSGQQMAAQYQTAFPHLVPGSLRGRLTVFPNVGGELLSGLAGMLRQPRGCFEQITSSTYPNLLVLNYLEQTEQVDPALRQRALDLIAAGYRQLTAYECQDGGYEWWGKGPGHEGLTAYGLMEFVDMAKVWDGVDAQMVKRTADWLLSRRDGEGRFLRNPKAAHQFGLADEATMSLYITWALTEAGYRNLPREIDYAYQTARRSQRPYQLGLAANTLMNVGRRAEARELLALLQGQQQPQGQWVHTVAQRSAPGSQGQSLTVETAALVLMALLKDPHGDLATMQRTAAYLRRARSTFGTYGNTNGTVLALRALVAFAEFSREVKTDGRVEVWVAGQRVAQADYQAGRKEPLVLDSLARFLSGAQQQVELRFADTETPLPYTLGLTWHTSLPASDSACAVGLTLDMTQTALGMGETARLTARVQNRTDQGQASPIARLALPAGLSWQPWQLKKLVEEEQVAFYEIFDQELVLYWRDLAPGAAKTIRLDVKAEVPGQYAAAASQAYLYYQDELRSWVALPKITIRR